MALTIKITPKETIELQEKIQNKFLPTRMDSDKFNPNSYLGNYESLNKHMSAVIRQLKRSDEVILSNRLLRKLFYYATNKRTNEIIEQKFNVKFIDACYLYSEGMTRYEFLFENNDDSSTNVNTRTSPSAPSQEVNNSDTIDKPQEGKKEKGAHEIPTLLSGNYEGNGRTYKGIIIGLLLALVVAVTIFWSYPTIEKWEKKPKIIGIYPSNIFGINQKSGLDAAFNSFCGTEHTEVIHLNLNTAKEMKDKNIQPLIDSLKFLLKNDNVIGIVGPSITEITPMVLQTLDDAKSEIPIFITSAIAREELKKFNHLNVFRLNTGIDDRGKDFSSYIQLIISEGKKISFLVEKLERGKSFGEKFLDEIKLGYKYWNSSVIDKKITIIEYENDKWRDKFDAIKSAANNSDFVFLLGVGGEFKQILNEFYLTSSVSDKPKSKFGSWMYGYALDGIDMEKYLTSQIFEITDFENFEERNINPATTMFKRALNKSVLTPGLRDEVFSYDSGLCLCQAFNNLNLPMKAAEYPKFNDRLLKKLNSSLESNTFEGVSYNRIKLIKNSFARSGMIQHAQYDTTTDRWKVVLPKDIYK